MTMKEATNEIRAILSGLHEPREVQAITNWILEDVTGLSRIDRLLFDGYLATDQIEKLQQYGRELQKAKPVQYVTGYGWFMGNKFFVNEDVLIPRPETEELVNWAMEFAMAGMSVIDIGTGSGCIPVMLKQRNEQLSVHAADISESALKIAQMNAEAFGVSIHFLQLDILSPDAVDLLPETDIIISNPPYIPLRDIHTMERHVVEHEPHLALFVPEEDPLVFYRKILNVAETKLKTGGRIFFETHHALAEAVASLSIWPSEIRQDAFGKQRMVAFRK